MTQAADFDLPVKGPYAKQLCIKSRRKWLNSAPAPPKVSHKAAKRQKRENLGDIVTYKTNDDPDAVEGVDLPRLWGGGALRIGDQVCNMGAEDGLGVGHKNERCWSRHWGIQL